MDHGGRTCPKCGTALRDADALDPSGEAHAACVEAAHSDTKPSVWSSAPLRRFFEKWWGAGHH